MLLQESVAAYDRNAAGAANAVQNVLATGVNVQLTPHLHRSPTFGLEGDQQASVFVSDKRSVMSEAVVVTAVRNLVGIHLDRLIIQGLVHHLSCLKLLEQ